MGPALRLAAAAGVVVALLAGTGCRLPRESPPSRYWLLAAPAEAPAEEPIERTVSVEPVELPSYLDRPEIVTRTRASLLRVAGFDLWAEPLAEAVARVLGLGLELRVPGTRSTTAGRRAAQTAPAYRLRVELSRFEAGPEGRVSLEGFWVLDRARSGGSPLAARHVSIHEPVSGDGVEPVVEAMSRALDRLGERVADALRSAPSP